MRIDLVCPIEGYESTSQKETKACMLLSIGIGTGHLQPEKDIHRIINRTYPIGV